EGRKALSAKAKKSWPRLCTCFRRQRTRRCFMSSNPLKQIAATALVLAAAALPAHARADRVVSEQQVLVNESRATFARFRDDASLSWFREHQKDALGFLIVSKAVRAGLVFGGSGGRAVLVVRNEAGE